MTGVVTAALSGTPTKKSFCADGEKVNYELSFVLFFRYCVHSSYFAVGAWCESIRCFCVDRGDACDGL